MGREQGDHLDDVEPTIYVGTVNGVEYERPVRTPAERINLQARGWVTKASLGRPNTPETTSSAPSTSAAPSGSTTDQQNAEGTEPLARRGGRRAPDVASAAPQDPAAAAAGEAG